MIPVRSLFEAHLNVGDLDRSMSFYGGTLGLALASFVPERKAAFYWLGGAGESMLGLWETGTSPQRMRLHIAFSVALHDLLRAPQQLQAVNIVPRDIAENPTSEPVVLAWMPAAALYFYDPDGHLLEYLAMLQEPARPELGVVRWSQWRPAVISPLTAASIKRVT